MKIGNCEIKNRIVMSPMLMGFGRFDGCVTEQLMDYYEERAKGGVLDMETEVVSGLTAYGPGYISEETKDLEP